MNIKTQINVLQAKLFFRRWSTLCVFISICIFSKFQAVSYDEPIEDPGENIMYVTKGTTILIGDSDIQIKQIFISKEDKKIKIRHSKIPKPVKASEKKIKTEQIKAVAILYSKSSSSENDLSAQGRKNIFFIAAAGDSQIKPTLQEYVDVLYVQNYLYRTSIVLGRLDDLFLKYHFSEYHAIRPPPVTN